uniref:Uncharacterized protein n=1 Tax=Picea sitchensis TaxID=3332 RepID=A0A6B9XWH5_PICSI|nr:hypothetical protein Q903MT_gene5430 [Picea sitchensis]
MIFPFQCLSLLLSLNETLSRHNSSVGTITYQESKYRSDFRWRNITLITFSLWGIVIDTIISHSLMKLMKNN